MTDGNRDDERDEKANGEEGGEESSGSERERRPYRRRPSKPPRRPGSESGRREASDGEEGASEHEEESADGESDKGAIPMPGEIGEPAGSVGEAEDEEELPEEPEEAWEGDLGRVADADRSELEGESLLPVRREFVEDLLLELGDIAEERSFHTLHREVHDERIPALREGQMSVVVLGEFNHGKSTVVNALLGEQILPVGITPTTATITHLVHADHPRVTVEPSDEEEEAYEVGYDEMDKIIREAEEGEGNEPEYVEIGYPNKMLEDNLVLVDTPGVNDISRQKVEITYGYVPRADVILYVLDATQVLKKSEITFIEDRLLEANRDRIIFVLGKVDALSDEEAAEVEEYARERLEEMIGPVDLYAFSGREALEAQQRGEELPEAFQEFRRELIQFLREEKAEIIVDSALGGGLRIASMLEQNLGVERQAYRLEKEELEERIQAVESKLKESRKLIAENLDLIEERIGGIAATAKHNLHVFRDDFLESLPRQIEAAESKDVQLYLSAWIQDQFKQWLETEGVEIAESLEALAEEVIETTNESIQEAVNAFREEFGLADQLDLEVDTIAYDMSVFALGTVGLSVLFLANTLVGGLLTAATPVLAMFLKGKVDAKIKEQARKEGEKAIREATEAIEEEMLSTIYEYGDRLEEFVETAGDRLYRQIQEALSQVKKEMGRKDRKEALAEVDERLEKVREVARLLKSSRAKLRG
jgi:ribosome biogenesis GTPase A